MAILCVLGADNSAAVAQSVFHFTVMVMLLVWPRTGTSISPAIPRPETLSVMNSRSDSSTVPAPSISLPSL